MKKIIAIVFGLSAVGLFAFPAISRAATNKTIGSYDTADTANDVVVIGSYAYVADGSDGVIILNISTPSAPTLAGSYDTAGTARRVESDGTYLYVADGASMEILSLANPTNLTWVGSYNPGSYTVSDVTIDGAYAYIIGTLTGTPVLNIVSVVTPGSPVLTGSLALLAGSAVTVSGNYAFVAGGQYLDIVNAAPTSPTLASRYTAPASAAFASVQVFGSKAYINDVLNGLISINISNIAAPTLASGTFGGSGLGGDVVISNGYAFLNSGTGSVMIYDIMVSNTPVIVDEYIGSGVGQGIAVADNIAYVANGASGIAVMDMSKPDSTPPIVTIIGPGTTVIPPGSKYTDPGASGLDNVDGVISTIVIFNNVNPNVVGRYSIIYQLTDRAGNVTRTTRAVIVAPWLENLLVRNGKTTITAKGKRVTLQPYPSWYRGAIIGRKAIVYKRVEPYYFFIATDSFSQPSLVIYNYLGKLVKRQSLATISTRGLNVSLAPDPKTLGVFISLGAKQSKQVVYNYSLGKLGLKSLGAVRAGTSGTAIFRLLKTYSNEFGLVTLIKGKPSTAKVWRYNSTVKRFVRDAKYNMKSLRITTTTISLR